MFTQITRCIECNRLFDQLNTLDLEEWSFGHDCEEMPIEYWQYVLEFRKLRKLADGFNVSDAQTTLENGPTTPAERMDTIEDIFDREGWEFPWHLIEEEA